MRVLICPDKFAGTLSAPEAAAALADGWRAGAPGDEVVTRPLADGGPGFVEVLAGLGGRRVAVDTVDPLGRPVRAEVLLVDDTAYLESAQTCGLHLLTEAERDPNRTTSAGLGPLVLAAIQTGVRQLVVGLGGSATNDAGAGLLGALGAVPLDETGEPLPPGGAALARCVALARCAVLATCAESGGQPALGGVTLVAATDVDSPLTGVHGASTVFGPQKGASREDVRRLDAALERFAAVLEKALPTCPSGLAALPGGGAAGGLGAAVLALGGRCESGIGLVRRRAGLDAALDTADLVVTGEGAFDHQSLRGKVVAGVAAAARDRGLPCLVVAGRVSVGRPEAAAAGVTEAYALVEHLGSVAEAMARPAEGLRGMAARLAVRWSR